VVTYGQDLLSAFFRLETVEHFAQVSLVTQLLGKQAVLSAGDVDKLLAARARQTTAARESGSQPPTDPNKEIPAGKTRRPR
jgi:L-fuculose-phosphate aldolase